MSEQLDELRARANLYRQFGVLLYREVSDEWLKCFREGIREEWEALGCTFDADMDADDASLRQELDAEFTTLWVAPGGVPRFESIFETGFVFQDPSDQVNKIYQQEGFVFDIDKEKSFPDHAGVELEFLGHLLERKADALEQGNEKEANRLQQVFREFLQEHPGTWVPAMMNFSIRCAKHSFYRELCRLVLSFLDAEIKAELPRREAERLQQMYERMPTEKEYDADFRKASGL